MAVKLWPIAPVAAAPLLASPLVSDAKATNDAEIEDLTHSPCGDHRIPKGIRQARRCNTAGVPVGGREPGIGIQGVGPGSVTHFPLLPTPSCTPRGGCP